MWLLDVNLPTALIRILDQFAVKAESTAARGWRNMDNGVLTKAASDAGFSVILTRDKLFGESAAKALKAYPKLAVVIIRIQQSREAIFLQEFRSMWAKSPLTPKTGDVIYWP